MKKIMQKAITVLGSAVLIGATIGAAAAANYPEPFTSGATIVVGANANPTDNTAALNIQSDLSGKMVVSGGSTTVSGGDSFRLEKTSVNYNLGDSMTDLANSLDEDDMPNALAEGTYKDDNRDEYDYEQKITVKDASLTLFTDTKYNDKEPTIGFNFVKNAAVLDYTITFKDGGINSSAIVGTDLPLMGSEYYVLSADVTNGSSEMELLDSSSSKILTEGESTNIMVNDKSYSVSIEYISTTEAKLNIDGEITEKLSDGESYELDDGSYVAIKEILYAEKEAGISKVEFTIGTGKLKLVSGDDIEMNDETIDGVEATFDFGGATGTLSEILIEWTAGEEIFLTEEDSVIVMPGFENFQVIYGGLEFPTAETTTFDAGDQLTLETTVKGGALDLEILTYTAANLTDGGDDYDLVYAASNELDLNLSDYFVVSSKADSGEEFETYAYELGKVSNSSSETVIRLDSLVNTDTITFDEIGDEQEEGNILFQLVSFDDDADSAVINVTAVAGSDATVTTEKVYTAEGLTINLPGVLAGNRSEVSMLVVESDKDGKVELGGNFTLNVSENVAETAVEVAGVVIGSGQQVDALADNEYLGYLYSELASSYVYNTDGDLNELTISYYGDEVIADVRIAAGDAVITAGEAGVLVVKDSEAASVSGNLLVVGGSAINSVAADLLGSSYSEAEFTAQTGVAAGQFLIQSFDKSGSTALLVAGYNAEDTTKAVTALLNSDVDTTVGKKYVSQSTTVSATDLVTA